MFGERSAHEQRRTRDERGIQLKSLAVFFAINIESEIARLRPRLPLKHDVVRSGFVLASLGGERYQPDCGSSRDGFDLGRSVRCSHLVGDYAGGIGCGCRERLPA